MGMLLGLVAGCGGGGAAAPRTASLDCAWIVGDNCWKQASTRAASCLPPESEEGLFSTDYRTCTYASGAVVTFDPPLTPPLLPFDRGKFTVATAGGTCLQFEKTQTEMILTVAGQTVRSTPPGEMELNVTCPDGISYTTPDAPALQSCITDPALFFGGTPGYASSYGTNFLALGLVNRSSTTWATQWVFRCSLN